MQIRLGSHRWEHREVDLTAAAVSGFVAGALIMVLELLWTAFLTDASPWLTSRRIAAILMGPEVLRSAEFSVPIVAMALVTHYLLGIAFSMILAALVAPLRLDSSMGLLLLVGALFGLLMYGFNFYVMTQFFSWIANMRGGATLVANVIFGMTAAAMYGQFERRDMF